MDSQQYKLKKQHALADDSPQRQTCYTCWKKKALCLCSTISPFQTRTEVVLLMHPKEAKKQKIGTGRMSLASLENSRMFCAINFDQEEQFQKLIKDPNRYVVLVYPANEAQELDGEISAQWQELIVKQKKILTLLLIDATWPCAKKMMKLSRCLHDLPTASFKKSYPGQFIIKHQPHDLCLSTLETIIHALNGLKAMGIEEEHTPVNNLWQPFNEMVRFQIKCAEDPSIPSNRGAKSNVKKRPHVMRVREKKNRLFYWDLKKSQLGDHHKKGS
jgi:DTW domain-containing protein YfiP